jgi:DNA-binding transcriptional regulator YiaG
MKDKKFETFTYEGLGFPIELINVPMKKIFGEWILDINLSKLQIEVLNMLIHKPTALQADELRFIRKYFEMTTTAFGEIFGVSHVAVLKWESGQLPSPAMDMYIRMYVMDRLKAKNEEFGKLYHQVSLASLAKSRKKRSSFKPFVIDAKNSTFAYA